MSEQPCPSGKIQYPSRGEAKAMLRVIAKKGSHWHEHTPKRAYKCAHCPCWHITAQTKDQARRYKRRTA